VALGSLAGKLDPLDAMINRSPSLTARPDSFTTNG
jgi:hypothetical protein